MRVLFALVIISPILLCPNEENCISCFSSTSKNDCRICEASIFNPSNGKCDIFPQKSIPYCLEYSDLDNCMRCEFGYFLIKIDSTNKCQKCDGKNCSKCKKNGKQCIGCFFNLRLIINHLGEFICSEEKSDLENCSINQFNANPECEVCKSGFVLNSANECQSSPIKNCWKSSHPDQFCMTCHYGYYITDSGTCASNGSNWWKLLVIAVLILLSFFVWKRYKRQKPMTGEYLVI